MTKMRQNTLEKKKSSITSSDNKLLQLPRVDDSPVSQFDSKLNLSKLSDISINKESAKCCHQLTYQQVECQIESYKEWKEASTKIINEYNQLSDVNQSQKLKEKEL